VLALILTWHSKKLAWTMQGMKLQCLSDLKWLPSIYVWGCVVETCLHMRACPLPPYVSTAYPSSLHTPFALQKGKVLCYQLFPWVQLCPHFVPVLFDTHSVLAGAQNFLLPRLLCRRQKCHTTICRPSYHQSNQDRHVTLLAVCQLKWS